MLFRVNQSAALVLTVILVFSPVTTADFEAGRGAWDAGRPAEALAQWHEAADAGDRRAMLALGRLYLKGLGAPQDYVLAHMWLNLAASRGEETALKERDALAAKMTAAERAEAQERAREWRPGGGEVGGPKAVSTKPLSTSPPPARATREAQELLVALGYKPGPVDGEWGARSARAYAAFLRDTGLPSGDTLTPKGLRAMRDLAKRRRDGTATDARAGASPRRPAVKKPPPDALHRAVLAGDVDGLNAALKAGVDVNARDRRGWTALMHTANKGYKLMVEALLEAKADPDVRAADGATALFIAALQGQSDIIEFLMKAGADISIKGPKGKTAVEVARARYGDAAAARQKNEVPAVVALLEGKTWVAAEEAEAADNAAFAEAKVSDTAASYAEYRTKYPNGRHAAEADRLWAEREAAEDHAAFENARAVNTVAAYRTYLSSRTNGAFREKARHGIVEVTKNTVAGSIFSGPLSDGYYHRMSLSFSPSGGVKLIFYSFPDWSSYSGTWRIDGEKVQMNFPAVGGFFYKPAITATAALANGPVLIGTHTISGKKIGEWRLSKEVDNTDEGNHPTSE